MKNPLLFLVIIFFASCQSQNSASEKISNEDVTIKLNSAPSSALPVAQFASNKNEWYSNINEIRGFENFEEENGILIGDKYSVATYSSPKSRRGKIVVLEEIRQQTNGETQYRKIDMLKIQLDRFETLTNEFCQLENNPKAAILAVYESGEEIAYAKNFVNAWRVNLYNLKLEPISTRDVKCLFEY